MAEMIESFLTPMATFNTSSLNQTSYSGDDQMTFSSAYLQLNVTFLLWAIVPPVLLVLGCYGNVMTIVVMVAVRASESVGSLSVYFIALAVSDLFLLWTNVLWAWPEIVFNTPLSYFHHLSCIVPMFVIRVSSMTSAWFLVAMTCQRMTSVVLPHRVDVLCTPKKGKIVTATILIASCVTNLHYFFHYRIEYTQEGYPSCVSGDVTVANIFSYLYLCLTSVLPFVVLIIANSVLIFAALQSMEMSGKMAGRGDTHTSSRVAKVSSMTTTLILTSVAFLLLTLPSSALWIYFEMVGYYWGEVDDQDLNRQLAFADTVCLLLWMSNSSINFYIYILSGKKFREEAKRRFCLCFRR